MQGGGYSGFAEAVNVFLDTADLAHAAAGPFPSVYSTLREWKKPSIAALS
jgi:hypothetical protein